MWYVVGASIFDPRRTPAVEEEFIMSMTHRVILAALILLVDLAIFFLPLTALFLAYILIYNPSWFREFLDRLDDTRQTQ